jgi:tetratricopeptide (TPR) repeat protein/DNA-binding CsgD family transcriptional regulator
VLSGETKTDSVYRRIIHETGRTERMSDLYSALAIEFLGVNLDSSFSLAGKSLNLAMGSDYRKGISAACIVLGEIALRQDRLSSAKIYLETALHFSTADMNPYYLLNLWNDLGYLSDIRSEYSKALRYYFAGLTVAENSGKREWMANLTNNIAVIYDCSGHYQRSLELYRKASSLFIEVGDSVYYANTLINQGAVYSSLGFLDSAESYFSKALPLQLQLKNFYGLANLYLGLGNLNYKLSKTGEAEGYFFKAMEMVNQMGPEYWGSKLDLMIEAEYNLGMINIDENRIREGLALLQSVRFRSEQQGLLSFESKSLNGISSAFARIKQFDSAYYYSMLYIKRNDSLQVKENKHQVAISEYEYTSQREMEKNAERLKLVKTEQNRQILILAIIIVSSLSAASILLLLFLLQKGKIKRMKLIEENLALEKIHLERDLEQKNRELTTSSMSLIQNNEMIEEISQKLITALDQNIVSDSDEIRGILHQLRHKQPEKFWPEFDRHFNEVHHNFYENLTKECSKLTVSELRLCAFLRLNLSTKEISSLTNKTEHSIKIARYRLRLKLQLKREDSLSSFLRKF